MNSHLEAALLYASKGWQVIPLHAPRNGGCSCGDPKCGSTSGKHPRIKNWVNNASADPFLIEDWWKKWPDANIGIVTGNVSNLVVLDIDPDKGGDDSLWDLEVQNGKLPDTVESLTGGGGRHKLFLYPGQSVRNSSSKIGSGLDIRGDGGFIVAPPSLHKSGRCYEWEASSDPTQVTVAPFPQWLAVLLVNAAGPTQKTAAGQGPVSSNQAPVPIPRGKRNVTLTSLAGSMRKRGFTADAIEAALRVVNQNQCVPPLPDADITKIAQSVGKYSIPQVPTDDELADKWLAKFPDTKYGLGEFRRYADGVWPVVPYSQVEGEILDILEGAKKNGYKPSIFKLRSVAELSRIKVSINETIWNSDPEILVCKNGTLHIPSRTIRAHSKSDYTTCALSYDYDPGAYAPSWDYLLMSTAIEAIDFLQEFAGYALTIETKYEVAVWLYGQAGTGKSTFITGLQAMLGTKAGVLRLADIERSRFALGDLPDKTLFVSTEQPAMYVTATDVINALISGEPIPVDRKFKTPVTIISRAKILWAMNEFPRVHETSSGLFRRVKVVEFPPLQVKPDTDLKKKISTEAAGILNWALIGLDRLNTAGEFSIPQAVLDATQNFKHLNDIPDVFVQDRCYVGVGHEVLSGALYAAYKSWCMDNGHKSQSSTSIAEDWKRLGFCRDRRRNSIYWLGVDLRP